MSPDATAPSAGYVRRLSRFDATMLVVGGIVGAGIFLNPAVVAQRVPTSALAIGVWVMGGAVALAGAFTFAELGARKPLAGGGYVYLRDAFGTLPGFLYGWTQLLVINSGGIAAVSVIFATYVTDLIGLSSGYTTPVAIGSILTLSGVNYFGIRPGAVVQNVLTVLKLVALAALIVVGFGIRGDVLPATTAASHTGLVGLVRAGGVALVPVLFAYGGWQSTNFVAAELKDARRDLPMAIVWGVVIVVVSYVAVNIVYVRVLGLSGLATSTAPASDVMERLLGTVGARVIAVGIIVSTFGFLNLAVLASPRMYQAMAADGVFFGDAAPIDRRHHVPAGALTIQALWAILLLSTRTYGQLLDYVVFGDWIFFGMVGATLFFYRARQTDAPAGFRTFGFPWVPLFFVVAAVFTVYSAVASNPVNAALGGGLIGLGIPAYFAWRWQGKQVRS